MLIGIAGPSCCGKSSVCRLLADRHDVLCISLDLFFRPYPVAFYKGYANWEIPESLMMDEFVSVLTDLSAGHISYMPHAGWTGICDTLVRPAPFMIAEGFLLFTDSRVLPLCDLTIYLDVSEDEICRRRQIRNHTDDPAYCTEVVIPHFRRFRDEQVAAADLVIDGNRPVEVVVREFEEVFTSHIPSWGVRADEKEQK
ncbi:MAG: (d)CMP kinase [Methanospirillaceae archaeon]|nr:(d)CMP kinase [Methanospirillaceae archaeon]